MHVNTNYAMYCLVPMIVCFFLIVEGRCGRMSAYDLREWGHLPKNETLPFVVPSVKCGRFYRYTFDAWVG